MKPLIITLFLSSALFLIALASDSLSVSCPPTEADMLGPFYKPDAPVRSNVDNVDTGYKLAGVVKSSRDCAPLPHAKLEFWLAGPDGQYDDAHRATVFADKSGSYMFESNVPGTYGGRPPHIHLRVTADGFRTLVTQHYPEQGNKEAAFDLVLLPVR